MKKNDKRICWNCEGEVSLHLPDCPYCGAELSAPNSSFAPPRELGDPFQTAPNTGNRKIEQKEWEEALDTTPKQKVTSLPGKGDWISLILLLPGVVFALFGLLLLFFSEEGVLTLHWNKNLAFFYFLGAVPLIFLGWRAASAPK